MSPAPSKRWLELTALLYASAAAVGLVATIRSFDRDLDILLVLWTFGMIAAFFGVAVALMGLFAVLRRDEDRADLRSVIGVLLFVASSLVTTGWWGVMAAALLLGGWLMGVFVRTRRHRAWRNEFTERQAFLRRLGKADPREDPESERFFGVPLAQDEQPASEPVSSDGYAVTRGELKRRAREIDQDPWQEPNG